MATVAASRAARAREQQVGKIHRDWCGRHPERAAEERALRQERRRLIEDFGHKVNGTIETHGHASQVRQGAIARLYRSGGISIEQMGSALELKAAHDSVIRDVTVGSGWGMDRVDISMNPEGRFFEALGGVRSEIAYSRWRRQIRHAGMVLAIIVEDCGIDAAARRFTMHRRTALRELKTALDLWTWLRRAACKEVDEAALTAAHAELL